MKGKRSTGIMVTILGMLAVVVAVMGATGVVSTHALIPIAAILVMMKGLILLFSVVLKKPSS